MSNRGVSISIDDLARATGNDPNALHRALDEVAPQPSAEIVPFPFRRQHGLAKKLRAAAPVHRHDAWLKGQIETYRARFVALGVNSAIIEREIRDLTAMLLPRGPKPEPERMRA